MPTAPEPLAELLLERLDTILRVLAVQVAPEKTLTERARMLKRAGVDNNTIARVLDTTNATVRTVTTNTGGSRRPKRSTRTKR